MKISAFCLTTNANKFQYPYIESIKSWADAVDELVVIDGGSTDGTVEQIMAIGNSKIRIVKDDETKWGKNWEYNRMGKNFNRGFDECTGDIIIKFDVDYVLHESATSNDERLNLRHTCQIAYDKGDMIISFVRKNLILVNSYYYKSSKTLGVNMRGVEQKNISVKYGIDFKRWGWGYEPIVPEYEENGIWFGDLLNMPSNSRRTEAEVFNYSFAFCDKETISWIRDRHIRAEIKQCMKKYSKIEPTPLITLENLEKSKEYGFGKFIKDAKYYYKGYEQIKISVKDHPLIMQDKVKSITEKQAGYNLFGNL